MNDFEKLMQELDNVLEEAWRVPLSSGKVVLDREEMVRISQGLHTHYPTEISRARSLLEEREKILLKARTDAEAMLSKARVQSEQILNEQDIILQARKYAEELRSTAEADAERIKRSAVEFADAVLAQAEEHYDKNLSLIQQARRVVRNQG